MSASNGRLIVEADLAPEQARQALEAQTTRGSAFDVGAHMFRCLTLGREFFFQSAADGSFELTTGGFGAPWYLAWFRLEGSIVASPGGGTVIVADMRPTQAIRVLDVMPALCALGVIAGWIRYEQALRRLVYLAAFGVAAFAFAWAPRRLWKAFSGRATRYYADFLCKALGHLVRRCEIPAAP